MSVDELEKLAEVAGELHERAAAIGRFAAELRAYVTQPIITATVVLDNAEIGPATERTLARQIPDVLARLHRMTAGLDVFLEAFGLDRDGLGGELAQLVAIASAFEALEPNPN